MMEMIRKLLESYPGVTPPMRVQTDLSGARTPGYALTQRGERLVTEDVLGRKTQSVSMTFHLRQVASCEADRQGAHKLLQGLGLWLSQQAEAGLDTGDGRRITQLKTGLPVLQEAYDDGTAGWSIGLELLVDEI